MKHLLEQMDSATGLNDVAGIETALTYLGHSALAGTALMLVTVWATYKTLGADGDDSETPAELILNSANVLFLCFGMTVVMLIVNNNLARAFAIGAAIALVRFRIKMNSKALSMGLFYGVLAGMASGVGQIFIGYAVAFFFLVLQVTVIGLSKLAEKQNKKKKLAKSLISNSQSYTISSSMNQPMPATPLTTQAPKQDI